jgi:DNA-binding NtrC family response regulator
VPDKHPIGKPDVLVVDDRPNMLQLLQKVLGPEAVVHTAASGGEAIAILEAQNIDAVVCDLRLPDMSGIDVLRACKRLQPDTAFVLMTAYASVPTAVEAMREGAYDYVTKPFDPVHLLTIVQRALSRAAPNAGEAGTVTEPPSQIDGTFGGTDEAHPLDLEHGVATAEAETTLLAMTWDEAMDLGRRETARQYLQAVLRKYSGRISEAAVHAGVERESFYRLLRRYGVQAHGPDEPEK